MENAISAEEFNAIKALRPHYKWRHVGDIMVMDYGYEGHQDRIERDKDGYIYTRHVHIGKNKVECVQWRASLLIYLFTDEMTLL